MPGYAPTMADLLALCSEVPPASREDLEKFGEAWGKAFANLGSAIASVPLVQLR